MVLVTKPESLFEKMSGHSFDSINSKYSVFHSIPRTLLCHYFNLVV